MEQNIENKIDLKDKLITFYKNNRLKVYTFFSVLIIILFSVSIFKINLEKKNNLIAEKFVRAGLYLVSDKKEISKNLYEEIILSKNKFYSILALNTILEKDLISDKNKIIKYFNIVEEIDKSKTQKDLIIFKKALYLIKIKNIQEGNKLLKNLVEENSELKSLAKEIISK